MENSPKYIPICIRHMVRVCAITLVLSVNPPVPPRPTTDTYHLGQNLNTLKHLPVVNTHDGANHVGHDDHVAQVGLDAARTLPGHGLLLCLGQTSDECLGLALEPARKAATSP